MCIPAPYEGPYAPLGYLYMSIFAVVDLLTIFKDFFQNQDKTCDKISCQTSRFIAPVEYNNIMYT
jgi:hypothetical protein